MKPRIFGLETEYGAAAKNESWHPEQTKRYISHVLSDYPKGTHLSVQRFLENGSNIHKCCGNHPEYATAECSNLLDLIAQDKAGERILAEKLPEVRLFKNNTAISEEDEQRLVSFGCHENYLTYHPKKERYLSFQCLLPFLFTRSIYTGTGDVRAGRYSIAQKMLAEDRPPRCQAAYRLSVQNLPLEDGYDSQLEVRCSDSNMSEIATYLKIGITALIIEMLEEGELPNISMPFLTRASSPDTFSLTCARKLSFDTQGKKHYLVFDGRILKRMSAMDIQRRYYEKALLHFAGDDDPVTKDILGRWGHVLDNLYEHPERLLGWVDSITKRWLLEHLIEADSLSWHDEKVKSVALQYHDIDQEEGLWYATQRELEKQGISTKMVSPAQIQEAIHNPPKGTRAEERGRLIKAHRGDIRDVDWDYVLMIGTNILLNNPFSNTHEPIQFPVQTADEPHQQKENMKE